MPSTEFPHDKKQAAAQVAKLKAQNAAKAAAKPKTRDLLHRGDISKIKVAKPAKKRVGPNIVTPMVAKKKPTKKGK